MKLTNTILVLALACGTGWAQNGPVIIQGAKADAAQQKQNANVKAVSVASPQSAKPAAATKPAAAQASQTAATKPTVVPVSKVPVTKPAAQPVKVAASQPATKPSASTTSTAKSPKTVAVTSTAKPVAIKPAVVKPVAMKPVAVKAAPAAKQLPVKQTAKAADSKPAPKDATPDNVSVEKAPEPAKNDKTKTYSANGRRDPFISPVVSQSAVGSGCSTGKRCLAVDQIALKGVVKSETGMIAVVVNALDKAYFLRENDPVFDGYVLKITTDSIVFKETVQDKLGKPFTKEVTKKLNTPAV
jgi:Tfp pilus assembly protein PilP